MPAESLSLVRAQTMKPKTVETFFNMLEKLATKNKISETPGNIFNPDKNYIYIYINNKPDSIIREKVSKNLCFNIRRKEWIYIRLTACCNAAGQFLLPILLFKDVNKKKEFGDSLLPGSDVYMKRKLSYVDTDLFINWFTEHFLKCKDSVRPFYF